MVKAAHAATIMALGVNCDLLHHTWAEMLGGVWCAVHLGFRCCHLLAQGGKLCGLGLTLPVQLLVLLRVVLQVIGQHVVLGWGWGGGLKTNTKSLVRYRDR